MAGGSSVAGRTLYVTALLVGCSTSVEPDATDGGDIPLAEFLAANSEALCEWSVRCGLLPNPQSCVDVGLMEWAQLEADVESGIVEYHAELAPGCLEYVRSEPYRSCRTPDLGWEPACGGVLVGTSGAGEPCLSSSQCREAMNCDTSMCAVDAACCAGTCAQRGGAGAPCASAAECADGHYCDDTGACRPQAAVGSACPGYGCVAGSMCGWDTETETGTCVATVGMGEPCEFLWQNCADWDAWCSDATSTCVRAGEVGDPCADYLGCLAYTYCDGTSCKPLANVGEPCEEGCLLYLSCPAAVCTVPSEVCTLP